MKAMLNTISGEGYVSTVAAERVAQYATEAVRNDAGTTAFNALSKPKADMPAISPVPPHMFRTPPSELVDVPAFPKPVPPVPVMAPAAGFVRDTIKPLPTLEVPRLQLKSEEENGKKLKLTAGPAIPVQRSDLGKFRPVNRRDL